MISFNIKNKNDFVLVEFVLEGNLNPEDLRKINPPDLVKLGLSSKTIILSGRGPIWLYVFLVHYYHPVKCIAIYDPRLDGAVITASHNDEYKVGDVIKSELFQ